MSYTPEEIRDAVRKVLRHNHVSLWLDRPIDSTTPTGRMHPEDIGHISRWVIEELEGK